MLKRIVGAFLVLALAVSFTTIASAQQETKKEAPKTEMKKDDTSKKEEAMGPLQSIGCDPACGFMAKSHDEKELIAMAKMHMKKHHKMDASDKEIKGMLKKEAPEEAKHQ